MHTVQTLCLFFRGEEVFLIGRLLVTVRQSSLNIQCYQSWWSRGMLVHTLSYLSDQAKFVMLSLSCLLGLRFSIYERV